MKTHTSDIRAMLKKLDSKLSSAQSRITALEESGKDLIYCIESLMLKNELPSDSQKKQVVRAIQVIWGIP